MSFCRRMIARVQPAWVAGMLASGWAFYTFASEPGFVASGKGSSLLSLLLFGMVVADAQPVKERKAPMVPLAITSTAFAHQGAIPGRHTCDGSNVSPPLSWSGVPAGAKSLALIVFDPDAPDPANPKTTWVHWILYNIPPAADGLIDSAATRHLPPGTLSGLNDWGRSSYGGPCPPVGKHRYFHTLYALDVVLPDLKRPGRVELEQAMQGHVLAKSELIGLYQRQR